MMAIKPIGKLQGKFYYLQANDVMREPHSFVRGVCACTAVAHKDSIYYVDDQQGIIGRIDCKLNQVVQKAPLPRPSNRLKPFRKFSIRQVNDLVILQQSAQDGHVQDPNNILRQCSMSYISTYSKKITKPLDSLVFYTRGFDSTFEETIAPILTSRRYNFFFKIGTLQRENNQQSVLICAPHYTGRLAYTFLAIPELDGDWIRRIHPYTELVPSTKPSSSAHIKVCCQSREGETKIIHIHISY